MRLNAIIMGHSEPSNVLRGPREMSVRTVIIDDSSFIVLQLTKLLGERMGHHIVAVGRDGNEAVDLYRMHQPDLITMDLSMPHKCGADAIEEILDEYPKANIVIISSVRGNDILSAIQKGARGFVEKPLRIDEEEFRSDFVAAIEEALRPRV